jgi:hypothetical protein
MTLWLLHYKLTNSSEVGVSFFAPVFDVKIFPQKILTLWTKTPEQIIITISTIQLQTYVLET